MRARSARWRRPRRGRRARERVRDLRPAASLTIEMRAPRALAIGARCRRPRDSGGRAALRKSCARWSRPTKPFSETARGRLDFLARARTWPIACARFFRRCAPYPPLFSPPASPRDAQALLVLGFERPLFLASEDAATTRAREQPSRRSYSTILSSAIRSERPRSLHRIHRGRLHDLPRRRRRRG